MSQISISEFKGCIPKSLHTNVTQEFVDKINTLQVDVEAAELFRDNLISYAEVLNSGRYKLLDYVNASLFVAFKMQGKKNFEAWCSTFPMKFTKYSGKVPDKDIYAYAATYNKGKLVQAIAERSMAVDHVLFADVRHKAIRRQAELMMSDNENVAQKAADSLMNHLKAPEEAKIKVDIGISANDTIAQLEQTLNRLAERQSRLIIDGHSTAKDVAHQPILLENTDD